MSRPWGARVPQTHRRSNMPRAQGPAQGSLAPKSILKPGADCRGGASEVRAATSFVKTALNGIIGLRGTGADGRSGAGGGAQGRMAAVGPGEGHTHGSGSASLIWARRALTSVFSTMSISRPQHSFLRHQRTWAEDSPSLVGRAEEGGENTEGESGGRART